MQGGHTLLAAASQTSQNQLKTFFSSLFPAQPTLFTYDFPFAIIAFQNMIFHETSGNEAEL